MQFALFSLVSVCWAAGALHAASVPEVRLTLAAPKVAGKPEVPKPLMCVYADVNKTGKKTIVCGDLAPPTLNTLLQQKPAVQEQAAPSVDPQQQVQANQVQANQVQVNQADARAVAEKCFGDKKKDEHVAVFVQQPEHHYAQPQVQYVQQQQPQVQYLQPQIQYVQPQVHLMQPQVQVIQQPRPQVHYVQAPPQVHYVQSPPQVHYVQSPPQVHYVQAPQVHYVHKPQSLCDQQGGSYYGRTVDDVPLVQLMRSVDSTAAEGPTVMRLMAVDDDDDDNNDNDNVEVPAMRYAVDPVQVSDDEPLETRKAMLAGYRPSRPVYARPTAFRAADQYPGDISADFQQQLSQQQQQQSQEYSSSLQASIGSGYVPQQQQQQLSYGGYSGQVQPSQYGSSSMYGDQMRSVVDSGSMRPAYGYLIRPSGMVAGSGGQQTMRSDVGGEGMLVLKSVEEVKRPALQIRPSESVQQQQQQQQQKVDVKDLAAPAPMGLQDNKKTMLKQQLQQQQVPSSA